MAAMPTAAPALRPLTVGEILDASFKVYRRSFVTMARAILVIAVPVGILTALIRLSITSTSSSLTTISPTGQEQLNGHVLGRDIGIEALSYVVTFVSIALITAVVYRLVGDVYLGHKPTWRGALGEGLRKLHSVVWITFVNGVFIFLIVFVPIVLIVVVGVAGHSAGLAVLVGFLFGIPAICGVVWYWVGSQFSVPALMLENYKGTKAIRRGFRLVRHQWWRSFGCLLLISIIVGILTAVVTGILAALLLAFAKSTVATFTVNAVTEIVTTVLFTPVTACTVVVLSIDLRVRKEGYDLHLLAQDLGTQPGSSALSFLPRPPVMWGGPQYGGSQYGGPHGGPQYGPWGGPQYPQQGGYPPQGTYPPQGGYPPGPWGPPSAPPVSPASLPPPPPGAQGWHLPPPPSTGAQPWQLPPPPSPAGQPPDAHNWPPPPSPDPASSGAPAPGPQNQNLPPPPPSHSEPAPGGHNWPPPPSPSPGWNQPQAPGWGAPQGQPEPETPPPLWPPIEDPPDGSSGYDST